MQHPKRIGAAMLLVGAGLAIAITLHPQGLRAPAWVAYLAAGLFAVAGATTLARAFERPRLADGFVCVLLAGMLLIAAWIAFAPGPRLCTGGGGAAGRMAVSETACRSAFGAGALIVGAMLALAVRGWWRGRPGR